VKLCRLEAELAKAGAAARQADEVRREVRFTRRNSGALQKHIMLADEEAAAARAEATAARADAAMARADAATMHKVGASMVFDAADELLRRTWWIRGMLTIAKFEACCDVP